MKTYYLKIEYPWQALNLDSYFANDPAYEFRVNTNYSQESGLFRVECDFTSQEYNHFAAFVENQAIRDENDEFLSAYANE